MTRYVIFKELFMARGEFPIQFACFLEAEEASWPNEMLLNKG